MQNVSFERSIKDLKYYKNHKKSLCVIFCFFCLWDIWSEISVDTTCKRTHKVVRVMAWYLRVLKFIRCDETQTPKLQEMLNVTLYSESVREIEQERERERERD